ncbi:MAG: hypothetical protein ACR2PR_12405 [Pseudohongiellaceae bacterium]
MNYETLKAQHRQERGQYPEAVAVRVHRALSWLDRAERCEDQDSRFIFLWIAFNASYAKEIVEGERNNESEIFSEFARTLVKLDKDRSLYQLIWSEFKGPIRILLENRYVYEPFWEYHRGKRTEADWKAKFRKEKDRAIRAVANQHTGVVLSTVLRRMYTLRNQLIHGGATWDSTVNRSQIRDCVAFLKKLVPLVIKLMMDNPDTEWGEICYPVIDEQSGSQANH